MDSDIIYQDKYLKYKAKYLKLKKQSGGADKIIEGGDTQTLPNLVTISLGTGNGFVTYNPNIQTVNQDGAIVDLPPNDPPVNDVNLQKRACYGGINGNLPWTERILKKDPLEKENLCAYSMRCDQAQKDFHRFHTSMVFDNLGADARQASCAVTNVVNTGIDAVNSGAKVVAEGVTSAVNYAGTLPTRLGRFAEAMRGGYIEFPESLELKDGSVYFIKQEGGEIDSVEFPEFIEIETQNN